ncbi:hypothetical protein [Clostridium botulinum]|uniref:hypothetical protein n=1 Tax=Clostridium botulinum TaxID=1491 RepID=UPI001E32EADE|nr:hypothetical protein [Clostridium botulinum]
MIKKKRIKEFCVAATLGGALMVGLHTTAYAVITDYAIKVNEQIFAYNQNELEQSFLNYKSGEQSRLYEDFRSKLTEGNGFYAFKDDKKGFVPYEAIEKGFLKSKDNNNKSFNINKFVEEDTCKPVEVQTIKKVSIDEKNQILIKENNTTDNKEVNKEIKKEEKPQNTSSSSSRRRSSSSSSSSKEVKPAVSKVPEVKKEEKQPLPVVIPEGNKEEVKKVIRLEPQISQGKVSIKSEITQTAQRPRLANYQVTTIIIEGTVENDGVFEIAGERVEVKKGDSYSKVADKIYNKFKNNGNWEVRFKYVQAGYKANLTFTSKEFKQHVDSLVISGNGIKFTFTNEQYGRVAIAERRESCTVTVLNSCESNNTLKIKVSSDILRKTFATLSVEIKAGDSKEKIAEKISNELKKNANINQYFTVKNDGSRIILTEKLADDINLTVTTGEIENKIVNPIKEEVDKQKIEEKKRAQAEKAEQEKQIQVQRDNEVKRQQQEESQKLAEVKSDVRIKSEITQTVQIPSLANYQVTTIIIEGTAENDGVFEVAGERVEVKKGDSYSEIANKIYNKFKNNENWEVRFKYIQTGYKSNLTFTSKQLKEHVESLVVSGNGIKFAPANEEYGKLAIAEKREICTVTVLDNSKSNNTLKVKVSSDVINKTFGTISVEIKAGDSKEKIAEKITNELKKNHNITQYFTAKNNGSQIELTQKRANTLNLKVELI